MLAVFGPEAVPTPVEVGEWAERELVVEQVFPPKTEEEAAVGQEADELCDEEVFVAQA